MKRVLFEKFDGGQVTDLMLEEASRLFREHYGVWNERGAQQLGHPVKAGNPVRLNKVRLREECLPVGNKAIYVKATVDGLLAGHVIACHWKADDRSVCWVTQLVVHRDYRRRGLAIGLLNLVGQDDVDVYGILSSHPAACMAAAKAFGSKCSLYPVATSIIIITGYIGAVPLNFLKDHAESIMKASPVPYVKDARLHGCLFDPEETSGLVSSADTGFWVDHTEPLEALTWARAARNWPLGDSKDGHEFLLVLDARHRV